MIYFVDEDYGQILSWAVHLKAKGLDAKVLRNADLAADVLLKAEDIDLVFIDVMLAVATKDSRFRR